MVCCVLKQARVTGTYSEHILEDFEDGAETASGAFFLCSGDEEFLERFPNSNTLTENKYIDLFFSKFSPASFMTD